MTETESTKHLIISGRVQGVNFRSWFVHEARDRDLHGWIRNRSEGTVEAVVHGPGEKVGEMIEKARLGAPRSNVTDVIVTDTTYDGPPYFEQTETV